MKKIEINVLITLHESVTLPALLYNAETWPLNKTIKKDIDKIEIWAWKSMLGLPTTTPNAAVMVCSGAMYASIRVERSMLGSGIMSRAFNSFGAPSLLLRVPFLKIKS